MIYLRIKMFDIYPKDIKYKHNLYKRITDIRCDWTLWFKVCKILISDKYRIFFKNDTTIKRWKKKKKREGEGRGETELNCMFSAELFERKKIKIGI